MVSLTWWTWVWASSRSWWWTGKPGVLQSMGRKESGTTELLNWTENWLEPQNIGKDCFSELIIMITSNLVPEKAMATHSSALAWKIPWAEEPGRLQSMGSLSQTWPRDFTFTFYFHALEKGMATHSSVLAWRIPGTGKPGWAAIYGVKQSRTRLSSSSSSSSLLPP